MLVKISREDNIEFWMIEINDNIAREESKISGIEMEIVEYERLPFWRKWFSPCRETSISELIAKRDLGRSKINNLFQLLEKLYLLKDGYLKEVRFNPEDYDL